ncbi:TAF5-like RNA polymerase II p300/CBP-associated factor-associated factor 65 kDa subunit 5L [Saccoglossus kowalevskii]|uniref:TAF5-like RNA polymerase II p300/CBP-associated factor-associated factor 65 kDa subunit 5L-like n=1 Tax=Saccoglossus kowalevskii TaxID=10224 RepID=A0ABM0MW56_SACKO|nr:PREDICTED: TAF5-like RNA polymerase II p300/CBP-associated factor-associated factor 65 kDa subunit 5L-like [Saccoglossus kowalevskii]
MMKRVRGEDISSAVMNYLKKRQYTDSETSFKKEIKCSRAVTEMASDVTMDMETSVTNTVSYTTCDPEPMLFDIQFSRLKTFIEEGVEEFKVELVAVLYPLFVNLYIEMICQGHKAAGNDFLYKYQDEFTANEEQRTMMDNLCGVIQKDDVLSKVDVKLFRESKYLIQLSNTTLEYLLRYLQSNDNTILLKMFNNHLHVVVQGLHNGDHDPNENGFIKTNISVETEAAKKKSSSSVMLRSLKDCIQKIRDGPPSLPSILYYSFSNTYQGLNTVRVSPDQRLLCGGFEDSALRVWSLSPTKLKAAEHTVDISKIHSLGDHICDKFQEDRVGIESKALRGHSGPVYAACFTVDSSHLLSSSEDTTVRLWDLDTYTNKVVYQGHNYPIWDMDTGSVGPYFATASQDHTARLWTLDRNYPLRIFAGHLMDVDCVRFHPNCNYIATGSSDRTVRLWSVQDGKCVRLFTGHKGTVFSLAFSPNGKFLASSGEDRKVKLWDLGSGNMVKELSGHQDNVYSLNFSNDSTMLASGGLDNTIRVWDVRQSFSPSSHSDTGVSLEILGSFPMRTSSVHYLEFVSCNLLLAAGAINVTQ